jgi:hypothetical protein
MAEPVLLSCLDGTMQRTLIAWGVDTWSTFISGRRATFRYRGTRTAAGGWGSSVRVLYEVDAN